MWKNLSLNKKMATGFGIVLFLLFLVSLLSFTGVGDIVKNADLILDSGPLRGGAGSTILDVTNPEIKILREGIITSNMIDNLLSK